jgi:hypothetical protein
VFLVLLTFCAAHTTTVLTKTTQFFFHESHQTSLESSTQPSSNPDGTSPSQHATEGSTPQENSDFGEASDEATVKSPQNGKEAGSPTQDQVKRPHDSEKAGKPAGDTSEAANPSEKAGNQAGDADEALHSSEKAGNQAGDADEALHPSEKAGNQAGDADEALHSSEKAGNQAGDADEALHPSEKAGNQAGDADEALHPSEKAGNQAGDAKETVEQGLQEATRVVRYRLEESFAIPSCPHSIPKQNETSQWLHQGPQKAKPQSCSDERKVKGTSRHQVSASVHLSSMQL